MAAPKPTPIYRLVHVDSLTTCLARGALHAPNSTPQNGMVYRTIHDPEVQAKRASSPIPCGPGGVAHDYVPFYFGCLSPMHLQLKTGQVPGHEGGQAVLIYLVTTAQAIAEAGAGFVFTDGHGIAAFTRWFDDLRYLDEVDWDVVNARYWADTVDDMDRKRRKQAEFLVHKEVGWPLIQEVAVIDEALRHQVAVILEGFPPAARRPVVIRRNWYY